MMKLDEKNDNKLEMEERDEKGKKDKMDEKIEQGVQPALALGVGGVMIILGSRWNFSGRKIVKAKTG